MMNAKKQKSMKPQAPQTHILFSPVGTRDPFNTEDCTEGSMLALAKVLRAEYGDLLTHAVVLLTHEMQAYETSHGIYSKALETCAGFSAESIETILIPVEDPSDFSQSMPPIFNALDNTLSEHPEACIHINVSSATPQMKFCLVLGARAFDTSKHSRLKLHQIKAPPTKNTEKNTERKKRKHYGLYDVEEALICLENSSQVLLSSEALDALKQRVVEPDLSSFDKKQFQEQLLALIDHFQWHTALSLLEMRAKELNLTQSRDYSALRDMLRFMMRWLNPSQYNDALNGLTPLNNSGLGQTLPPTFITYFEDINGLGASSKYVAHIHRLQYDLLQARYTNDASRFVLHLDQFFLDWLQFILEKQELYLEDFEKKGYKKHYTKEKDKESENSGVFINADILKNKHPDLYDYIHIRLVSEQDLAQKPIANTYLSNDFAWHCLTYLHKEARKPEVGKYIDLLKPFSPVTHNNESPHRSKLKRLRNDIAHNLKTATIETLFETIPGVFSGKEAWCTEDKLYALVDYLHSKFLSSNGLFGLEGLNWKAHPTDDSETEHKKEARTLLLHIRTLMKQSAEVFVKS
jgi:hypothetical protein